ncbi:hypothetical protein CO008_00470 [Candidatus Roizmanbacteria bacterium CG_4_8_14_3_um_filter_36_12]|nr:MAG: hypothetical protein CO008_00470 [Candidatus Roizmanbacteria bacterium CG_4_8_14_3_um_filter_36_12]
MNNINPMNKRFPIILLIVSLFLVGIAYFLLQPRVSNMVPFIRTLRLSSFIKNTIKNNSISVQEFWQLREFYSPGIIQFNKPNLTFTSDRVVSHEDLIDKNLTLESLLPQSNNWHIVYKKTNELIATSGEDTLIYFIKPISEMAQANGFYDYKDKDKKMLENKNWYVITKIQK